jgi:hypothetical protein
MVLAFFRSLMRAPETKMGLLMPVILLILFASMLLHRVETRMNLVEPFMPTGLAFLILFGLVQNALNQFGFDRHGFRALVLMPVRRSRTLMAKNLALLALSLPLMILLALLLFWIKKVRPDLIAAGVLQFLAGFLLLSLMGNFSSIYAPYRVAPGSLKRTKTGKQISLMLFLIHLLYPIVMAPIFLPALAEAVLRPFGLLPGVPICLLLSILLLGLTVLLYGTLLQKQGDQLHRREQHILETVTREVE